MAQKTIDQFPAADSVASSDLLLVETQSGTKKATKAQIAPTLDSTPTSGSNNGVTSGGVYTALSGKQGTLTFDSAPTSGSTNPVTSGGVHTALSGKQNSLTFDSTPTSGSSNPVTSGGVYSALSGKQNTLTFDSTPTANSSNPVTSGGVHTALSGKVNTSDTIAVAHGGTGATTAANARTNLGLGSAATLSSTSSVTSGGTSLPTAGAVYSYTKQVYISSSAPSSNQSNYLWVKPS